MTAEFVDEVARKAAPFFALNNWSYGREDSAEVPDALRLARMLDGLVETVRGGSCGARSGRFIVAVEDDHETETAELRISLDFGAIDWPYTAPELSSDSGAPSSGGGSGPDRDTT